MEARFRKGTKRFDDSDGLPSPNVYSEKNRRGSRYRKEDEPPLSSLLLAVTFVLGTFLFVRYIDHKLPVPLTVADVAKNPKR